MNAKLDRTRLESWLPLRHDRGLKPLELGGMVNARFPSRPLGAGQCRKAAGESCESPAWGAIDLDRPAANDHSPLVSKWTAAHSP
jgi:hypothetical protein